MSTALTLLRSRDEDETRDSSSALFFQISETTSEQVCSRASFQKATPIPIFRGSQPNGCQACFPYPVVSCSEGRPKPRNRPPLRPPEQNRTDSASPHLRGATLSQKGSNRWIWLASQSRPPPTAQRSPTFPGRRRRGADYQRRIVVL